MSDATKFVILDGDTHIIAEGEHTACYLVIPHGSGYTTSPDDDVCTECARKTGYEAPKKPKAKAKAKSDDET